jgi:DNA-binding transcriptional ArsR family regulator
MTAPFEDVARKPGRVYVLAHLAGDRAVVEQSTSVAHRLVVEAGANQTAAMEEYLDDVAAQHEANMRRARAAWHEQETTMGRTLAALRDAGEAGMRCIDVQKALGLGHGAVSGALAILEDAGAVVRLETP